MTENSLQEFPKDFLNRFPAFRGALERSDRMLGEQWLRVWQAAKEEAAACVRANASLFSTPEACESLVLKIIQGMEGNHSSQQRASKDLANGLANRTLAKA